MTFTRLLLYKPEHVSVSVPPHPPSIEVPERMISDVASL
jgi:hypothetical protein